MLSSTRRIHLPLASLTRVHTAGAWPYRVGYYNQLFCLRGHLGGVSKIQTLKELTSCSSLIHSHMFPLLDVLYRQVWNLSFGH